MADFCWQCTENVLGIPPEKNDFAGVGKDDPPLKEGEGYEVLCEGCGFTLVDKTGKCITSGCKGGALHE